MKCLLCIFKNNDKSELQNHYLNIHQVDRDNQFFKKLFGEEQNNVFYGKKCLRCNEFLPTTESKAQHDFLKHYDAGRDTALVEEKPIAITTIGPIKIYEIRFENHSADYDFHNSEQVVDDFLFNVKSRIENSSVDFLIRCGFSLQNIQPSPEGFGTPLRSSRYWSTDPLQSRSFNDFILFNIRDSILKKVISNGLTGSSWRFERFNYINIKTASIGVDNLAR